ncbi:MAG: hypothetical protein WBN35_12965 [Acidimicrobiia bacterium]
MRAGVGDDRAMVMVLAVTTLPIPSIYRRIRRDSPAVSTVSGV